MERLIDLFCDAIRISDPLSIKISVGITGGGIPLIFMVAALMKLGEFWSRQLEATVPGTPGENAVPDTPDRGKESLVVALAPSKRSNRLEKWCLENGCLLHPQADIKVQEAMSARGASTLSVPAPSV